MKADSLGKKMCRGCGAGIEDLLDKNSCNVLKLIDRELKEASRAFQCV